MPWSELISEICELSQNLVYISYNILLENSERRITMLCSKDTAKDTGLNIWVDADPDGSGHGAKVE